MNYKKAKVGDLLKLSIKDIVKLPKNDQINILEKLIHYHNVKYFIENNPVISDEEFDELTRLLKKLKPDSPVLFEIVGEIGNVIHPEPMLSIDKKFTYEEIRKWIEETNDTSYIVEPKYDGMAARYQNGILSTRGNGYIGENISDRLPYLTIKGTLPKNPNVSVYGEVVIPLSYFDKYLYKEYKNPRNAVVGIMKAKKIKPTGIKALLDGAIHFVIYDQNFAETVKKKDLLDEETWESILEEVLRVDYPLDGVVIKVKDKKLREKLGYTQHHARWQIAYKMPAERKWTKVKAIIASVGRTGRVTNIAVIKPVELSGATITNVTLHNYDFVIKSRIGIGSKVQVTRSGEVIPFITAVKPAKKPYKPPTRCPICNTRLTIEGKYLVCPNKNCPARLAQSIEYFFKSLGAEWLGIKTIETLMSNLKLKNVIDFYNIKKSDIAKIPGFGEKSAKNIINSIKNTLKSTVTPYQLLQALGIKYIGPAASRWIINNYGFENLPKLKIEDLTKIKGIGPEKAEKFVKEIKEKWWIVEELKKRGLHFKKSKKTSKLKGLKFCITGKKGDLSREELIELINQNGGEYKSNVTKDLDYLIAGENAGSKIQKAKKYKVKIISEKDFLEMINK